MTEVQIRDARGTWPQLAVLLGAVCAMLAGAELATRYVVMPSSRIERRVDTELAAAPGVGGPRSFLLVGNSLLLYAVRDSAIASLAPQGWRARRLAVEQTSYLDWKYGLTELHRRGAQPAVLGVMLDPWQLTSTLTRTDYSALRLVGASDVIAFGRDASLHPTDISRLILSHYSAAYGFRAESRKVLLGRMLPGMERLSQLLIPRSSNVPDTLRTRAVAARRLRALRDAVVAQQSRFIFFLPPRLGDVSELRAVLAAARDAGVEVIGPALSTPYAAADFMDGYHLSDVGAARYAAEVARALSETLR